MHRFGENPEIIRGLDYVFTGQSKHSDSLVSDVVLDDPEYIQHLIDDFDVQFKDEVLDLL